MSARTRRWAGFALLAAGYVAVAYLSRLTRLEDTNVSLIWLASGYATTWMINQRTRTGSAAVLAWIALSLPVVLATTGGTAIFLATATAANVLQTLLFVVLLLGWERRRPSARGLGGAYTFTLVVRSIVAAAVATGVAATLGGLGLALGSDTGFVPGTVQWWGRNLLGVVLVGSLTHLTFEQFRRDPRSLRLFWQRRHELSAVGLVSLAVYALILAEPAAALTFLALPVSVWLGWRFPIWVATVHAGFWGTVTGVATLRGEGPFALLDPTAGALLLQLFLLTTLLTSLILGGLQAQRSKLIADLIAAEAEVAERAELLDVMTETMSEGLLVINERREVVRVNSAARLLLDEAVLVNDPDAPAEVLLTRVDGSPLPPSEHPAARVRAEEQVAPYDLGLPLADGGRRILSVSASALHGGPAALGGQTALMIVFRDVTEDREQRNQLARFAGTVAHDLRSPLTSVRGWLELAAGESEALAGSIAADGLADVRLERARNGITRARQSAVLMTALIEDLLAQATAEGSALSPTPIELGGDDGLVADVVDLLAIDADVETVDVPTVVADEDMLRQLLANLLGNAVKYIEPGRRPHIRITGTVRRGRVVVAVTDNGIGIPAGQHDLVFERFHRAHARDARFTGTGLGLAICRTIVERHGGTLTAAPGPGEDGTTFRFDLTADTAAVSAVGEASSA